MASLLLLDVIWGMECEVRRNVSGGTSWVCPSSWSFIIASGVWCFYLLGVVKVTCMPKMIVSHGLGG